MDILIHIYIYRLVPRDCPPTEQVLPAIVSPPAHAHAGRGAPHSHQSSVRAPFQLHPSTRVLLPVHDSQGATNQSRQQPPSREREQIANAIVAPRRVQPRNDPHNGPPNQAMQQMLRETAERGSNCLQVLIAKPPEHLGSQHQLVFFDLYNEGRRETYWSFKATVFGTIVECARQTNGLNDTINSIVCYPRSDPSNSANILMRKVKASSGTPATFFDLPQHILGFTCNFNSTQQDVERYVKTIVASMITSEVQQLYYQQRKYSLASERIIKDCIPESGQMWRALSASLSLTRTTYVNHLDEIVTLPVAIKLSKDFLFPANTGDIDDWEDLGTKIFTSRLYSTIEE
jgi:hypothetical protein